MLVNNGGVSTDSMMKGSNSADVFHDALTLHVTSAPPPPHLTRPAQPRHMHMHMRCAPCTPCPLCAPAVGRGVPAMLACEPAVTLPPGDPQARPA